MKINILTQPLFCNYGGILQNYALQEVLRRMGHDPITINVPTKTPKPKVLWKDTIKIIMNFSKRLRGCYQYPFLSPHRFAWKEYELSFPQREFVAKHINKIDVEAPFSSDLQFQFPADAWIVGSDQVWRPWCSPYIENCFFDFLKDTDFKRLAYSASFGTDKWEISPEKAEILKPLAKKFDAISVREESGVKLCAEYLEVDAKHLLDPTMLLTKEDYLQLIEDKDKKEGDFVASYVLDIDSKKAKEIKQFAKRKNLKIEKLGQMHRDRFDSVESWISGIASAKYVITDSFHGTVFSLLFDRPVKILGNALRGNTRIDSLFKTLKVEKTADGFYRMTEKSKQIQNKNIIDSLDFLKNNLSK